MKQLLIFLHQNEWLALGLCVALGNYLLFNVLPVVITFSLFGAAIVFTVSMGAFIASVGYFVKILMHSVSMTGARKNKVA